MSDPTTKSKGVFRRLLRMLRPHWGMIGLGLALLILSMPCELFPGLVWKYVTDDLILKGQSPPTRLLPAMFSFGGALTGWKALLASALLWLLVVYVIGEALSTLSNNLMNRVAQKFMLELSQPRLSQASEPEPGVPPATAHRRPDEPGDGRRGRAAVVHRQRHRRHHRRRSALAGDGGDRDDGGLEVASASLAPLVFVYVLLRIFNKRIAADLQGRPRAAGGCVDAACRRTCRASW